MNEIELREWLETWAWTLLPYLLMLGKSIFAGAGFSMNLAVLLTWTDRRYGSMLQDRIGPDRAVVYMPKMVARGGAFVPALLTGGAVVAYAKFGVDNISAAQAFFMSQLAIFMAWFTLMIITDAVHNRGVRNPFDQFLAAVRNPRDMVYGGFAAHVFALLVLVGAGTGPGHVREFLFFGGTGVLFVSIIGGAGYAAAQMVEDQIGLRLLGLLHPAADGLKSIFKEDFVPEDADKLLHGLAPFIAFFPTLVVLAIVPFGDTLCFEARENGAVDIFKLLPIVPRDGVCTDAAIQLQVVDLNIGVLYFFALAGTGIVGAALAGWASNNKYSLMGGLRAAGQMVSYEVTLGLTLVGAIMIYGTVQVDDMVRWQVENTWGVFVQPLAFVLFFAAAVAESKRIPFDIPEGVSELVAGYFLEYSGMKFSMFFLGEYIAVVTSSALMVAIFFGGWHIPFLYRDGITMSFGDSMIFHYGMSHGLVVLIGFLAFIVKSIGLCMLQLTIRWTLPRFRYDQLMKLGWRMLLPLSLANILATGVVVLALDSAGTSVNSAMTLLCDFTELFLVGGAAVIFVLVVRFLLQPAEHRRVVASTSAKYAEAAGGTLTAKMGA